MNPTSSSKSICLPHSVCPLALMGLFLYSFKFQMGSLYISWQLSRSTKKKEKNKKRNKSRTKRVCIWKRKSGVLSGGGQNGKHFLFFLFLFSTTLFPLTLVLNPELLKKPPWFSSPLPGVVCNNAGSVTVVNLCIHRPSLQVRDLPNTHSQQDEGWVFNYNRKLCFIILPSKTYWFNSIRALRKKRQ